jgi:hypothetical protein
LRIDFVGAQNLAPATVKNGTLQIDLVGAQNLAPVIHSGGLFMIFLHAYLG